ncbi:MAG: hypothetical protein CL776_01790 [Chloroflexi bacterium]|nr:hypothetical protein [Chloroflexota bacterium]
MGQTRRPSRRSCVFGFGSIRLCHRIYFDCRWRFHYQCIRHSMKNNKKIEVLAFCVTGTSVEWLEPVKDSLDLAVSPGGIFLDWTEFAISWRLRSQEILTEIAKKERSWLNMTEVNFLALKELIPGSPLDEWDDLRLRNVNQAWSQLRPWPDTFQALRKLNQTYKTFAVSNCDDAMLATITKNLQLPWENLISAQKAQAYKPEEAFYKFVISETGVTPDKILFVSSSLSDLQGASLSSMKTAYIKRVEEFGYYENLNSINEEHDFEIDDLVQLANQL